MRVSFYGLLLALLSVLLMLAARTVPAGETGAVAEVLPSAQFLVPLLPDRAQAPQERELTEQRHPDRTVCVSRPHQAGLMCPREADHNGLPILNQPYYRSNYQAFCLTDSGG